jgi:hypothetical protein
VEPGGHVSVYRIGANGALKLVGSPFPAGFYPDSVVADPSGRFVYVGNAGGESIASSTISGYSVAPNGVLTPLPGSPYPEGASPVTIAIDPLNHCLYAANFYYPILSAFHIGANGLLTSLAVPFIERIPQPDKLSDWSEVRPVNGERSLSCTHTEMSSVRSEVRSASEDKSLSCMQPLRWSSWSEVRLVSGEMRLVDALVVSGVERAAFFRFEREIAEALAGAHFPWAQDQVIGVCGADRVAVLGEGELDGGQGVPGFEGADFGPADSVKFLEGQGASAAVGGEIHPSASTVWQD